jgi:hypothetical protein
VIPTKILFLLSLLRDSVLALLVVLFLLASVLKHMLDESINCFLVRMIVYRKKGRMTAFSVDRIAFGQEALTSD